MKQTAATMAQSVRAFAKSFQHTKIVLKEEKLYNRN